MQPLHAAVEAAPVDLSLDRGQRPAELVGHPPAAAVATEQPLDLVALVPREPAVGPLGRRRSLTLLSLRHGSSDLPGPPDRGLDQMDSPNPVQHVALGLRIVALKLIIIRRLYGRL